MDDARGAYRGFHAKARGFSPISHNFLDATSLAAADRHSLTAAERTWRTPYVGITTDGRPRTGLYELEGGGWQAGRAVSAAQHYLQSLDPSDRAVAITSVDADEWRLWTNAIPTWSPTVGVLLETLTTHRRAAAMSVVRQSLSAAGYAEIRTAMKLNAALGELIDDFTDTLTEYMYRLTIFGEPAESRPWGWQLTGHHLDLNCMMIDGRMVLAPVFVGAEPTEGTGRFAGLELFREHHRLALQMRNSLTRAQEASAVLGSSLRHADLPEPLRNRHVGRTRAGAGADNAVIAYEGIPTDRLSAGQRALLLQVIRLYVERMPTVVSEQKCRQIKRHEDELRFAWRGGNDDGDPFYYRIHSPVVLIEFDHHAGAFLNNEDPQPFHCHTVVREPNGNDYAKDLLRQHQLRAHRSQPAGRGTRDTPVRRDRE